MNYFLKELQGELSHQSNTILKTINKDKFHKEYDYVSAVFHFINDPKEKEEINEFIRAGDELRKALEDFSTHEVKVGNWAVWHILLFCISILELLKTPDIIDEDYLSFLEELVKNAYFCKRQYGE